MTSEHPDTQRLRQLIGDVVGEPLDSQSELPNGLLSSVITMRLVIQIERSFAITVSDDELRAENFESLSSILALIDRSRAAGIGAA